MIKHQTEKYNWEFVYLGANQDAFTVAGNIGINLNCTMNYNANKVGVKRAFTSLSNKSASYRTDNNYNISKDNQARIIKAKE